MIAYLVVVDGPEVEGHECEPYDTRGVHGESDELGFVEIFRNLARLDRINRAGCDQGNVVHQRCQETGIIDLALEHDFGLAIRIREPVTRRRRLYPEPETSPDHLFQRSRVMNESASESQCGHT